MVEILRFEKNKDYTLGILKIKDKAVCLTMEPPDKDNEKNKSCIPEGCYLMQRKVSKKFGITFAIKGIPHRTNIIFHKGNIPSDTKGCVLLGSRFGVLKKQNAILDSKAAFNKFMQILNRIDNTVLVIKDVT
jgi:hypothetical protein